MTDLKSSTHLTDVEPDPIKRDFRLFLYLVWKSGFIPGNPDPTEVQLDIARFLQLGPKRCVIQAFRGVGKSWITSAFVVWLLYCDPQLNILVVSASKERADQFSTFTMRLIHELPVLRHLIPTPDQRNSKIAFDVAPAKANHSPSVKSAGITGQITGSRADVIIADDVEVPNNSATPTLREKLSETIKEFDAILKPLPGSRIIYLGTPQTEESIYSKLPERGYVTRIWPARYPQEDKAAKYGDQLAPKIAKALRKNPKLAGKPTDPKRFNEADLLEREASYGRSGFALQFQLDTSLSDADRYPLKLADLVVMDLDPVKGPVDLSWGTSPELILADVPNVGMAGDRLYRPFRIAKDDWTPYDEIILVVDPSGRGSDETAYAVLALLHARIFLLDAGGFKGGYEMETLEAISRKAREFKVHRVIVEPNFGDGMFNRLLDPVMQRIYPCTVEETERSSSQKEKRIIDTLEPVMNQHRLVVDRRLLERDYKSTEDLPPEQVNRYRLFYQMTRITKDKGALVKDDRLDCLALGVAHFTDRLDRDAQKAAEDHRARLLDEHLASWHEGVLGGSWGADAVTIYSR